MALLANAHAPHPTTLQRFFYESLLYPIIISLFATVEMGTFLALNI